MIQSGNRSTTRTLGVQRQTRNIYRIASTGDLSIRARMTLTETVIAKGARAETNRAADNTERHRAASDADHHPHRVSRLRWTQLLSVIE